MRRTAWVGLVAAVALGVTAPAGAVVGELPPEVAQPLCDVLRQAMTEVSDDLKAVHDGIGCQDVPPGEPGGDPLADVQAQACAELANLAKEAEKNGAPAELVAGLQTVRRDVVGCPTDASPTTTTTTQPDDPDQGGTTTTTAPDDPGTTTTTQAQVLGSGTESGGGSARSAGTSTALPATGAASVLAPIGLGATGLAALLRRLAR